MYMDMPLTGPQHDRRNPGPQSLLQLRPYLPLLRRVVTKGKVEEIRERKVWMNKEIYDEKRFQKDRVATSKGFGNTDPIGKKDMGVRFV